MYPHLTIPIGTVFGRLTVIGPSSQRIRQLVSWGCRCECGNIIVAPGSLLTRGRLRSCGCLLTDIRGAHLITHGKRRTSEYHTWASMRSRCLNPRVRSYPLYGGRGIAICPEWDDFAVFLRDMGTKPSPSHSLDRIDNDGPYSPTNCRWATPGEQSRNRRPCRSITWRGETRVLTDWAAVLDIPLPTLSRRLSQGWSMEDAFTRGDRRGHRVTGAGHI